MSGAGLNGLFPVAARQAAPPRLSIRSTLPTREFTTHEDWENGLTFDPEPCIGQQDHIWWDCPLEGGVAATASALTGGAKTIDDSDHPSLVSYRPWTAWEGDRCTPSQEREGEDRARRLLNQAIDRKIERELWTGDIANAAGFPNVALIDAATQIDSDIVPLFQGFAYAQQWLAERIDGRGVFHMQPIVASLLGAAGFLRREGNALFDVFDNVVVAGQGYPGTGPGGVAHDTKTSWIYATSMIEILLGPVEVIGGEQEMDRNRNTVTFRAERAVAASLDGCALGALELDWCQTCCESDSPFG